jgi:hypothetical protein
MEGEASIVDYLNLSRYSIRRSSTAKAPEMALNISIAASDKTMILVNEGEDFDQRMRSVSFSCGVRRQQSQSAVSSQQKASVHYTESHE